MAVDTKAKSQSVLTMGMAVPTTLPEGVSTVDNSLHLLRMFAEAGQITGDLPETLNVSDSYDPIAIALAPIDETLDVVDTWTASTPGQTPGLLFENLAVTDQYGATVVRSGLIEETLSVVDGYVGDIPMPEAATIDESLVVSDEWIGTIPGEDPPEDPDNDVAYTVYFDCDGQSILVPRPTIMHSVDSLRNADLVGPDRVKMDAFEGKSNRTGHHPRDGRTVRIVIYDNRADRALSIREVRVEYEVVNIEPTRENL